VTSEEQQQQSFGVFYWLCRANFHLRGLADLLFFYEVVSYFTICKFFKLNGLNALLVIPSIGFIIALVPPTLLALLTLGWRRALLVLGCLVLTEMLGENVLKPMLLKKGLNVSLIEVTLSLMGWGFLLGPAGAVLSVPLTLGLRRLIGRERMNAYPQS
jgi:hypothetical protein